MPDVLSSIGATRREGRRTLGAEVHMIERGTVVTHDVADAGTWYTEGATVHIDQVESGVHIVPDPDGDYEVMGCQHVGTLQVQLRKIR